MQSLELGICSWSIDRCDPVTAIQRARRDLDLGVVHVGFFGNVTPAAEIAKAAANANVELSATFVAFENEDYSSIARVAATVGFNHDERIDERFTLLREAIDVSAALRVNMLAMHLGTIADDPAKLRQRVQQAADMAAEKNLTLLAETGPESPDVLKSFIESVDRPNVAVNFDPGNLVMYATGDPVSAVTTLRRHIKHVHVKDVTASANPGVQWGTPVPLGTGDVSLPRVISKLRARGYDGPLIIERTAKDGDLRPLTDDLNYLRSMFA